MDTTVNHIEDFDCSTEGSRHYRSKQNHIDNQDYDVEDHKSHHNHSFPPVNNDFDGEPSPEHQYCSDLTSMDFEGLEIMDILNYTNW